jgi:hypothetical protein
MSTGSEEIWNGETRRKNDVYLKSIEDKIDGAIKDLDKSYNFLKVQFGDIDLAGNKVEGEVSKSIRLLTEKVTIQNGRIGKLESDRDQIRGAATFATILISLGGLLLAYLAIHK